MAAIESQKKEKAVVVSVYSREQFAAELIRKIERRGIEIVKLVNPDRGEFGKMPDGATIVLALTGLKSMQYGFAKEWARKNGCRYTQLSKNAADWPDTFGTPNLQLVPPPPPSSPKPVVLPPEPEEPKPVQVVEALPKVVEQGDSEAEELAKLYAIENAELRVKLAELTKTVIDPQDMEQLTKTRQKNAAALAVKTKMVNKLEAENVKLQEELEVLRKGGMVTKAVDTGEVTRLNQKVTTLEAELTAKRRTMNEWEVRMKKLVDEKSSLETDLVQARNKIAMLSRQQVQPKEVVKEVVKEVIVNKGSENMQRLIAGLQTMIDEGMLTAEEAFKKLSLKYK